MSQNMVILYTVGSEILCRFQKRIISYHKNRFSKSYSSSKWVCDVIKDFAQETIPANIVMLYTVGSEILCRMNGWRLKMADMLWCVETKKKFEKLPSQKWIETSETSLINLVPWATLMFVTLWTGAQKHICVFMKRTTIINNNSKEILSVSRKGELLNKSHFLRLCPSFFLASRLLTQNALFSFLGFFGLCGKPIAGDPPIILKCCSISSLFFHILYLWVRY